jgi:hypothetical protein
MPRTVLTSLLALTDWILSATLAGSGAAGSLADFVTASAAGAAAGGSIASFGGSDSGTPLISGRFARRA